MDTSVEGTVEELIDLLANYACTSPARISSVNGEAAIEVEDSEGNWIVIGGEGWWANGDAERGSDDRSKVFRV